MKEFTTEEVKKFYDELDSIWKEEEKWYYVMRDALRSFLHRLDWDKESYVLNAGSGNTDYGLPYRVHYSDISDKHMKGREDFTHASVEDLPFEDNTFDHAFCIGTVLNYTDSEKSIAELARVIKPGGELVLEFESSLSYQHKDKPSYGMGKGPVTVEFYGEYHHHLLYSESYVIQMCERFGLKLRNAERFHILSALVLSETKDEIGSAKFIEFDSTARGTAMEKHANNIILRLEKAS